MLYLDRGAFAEHLTETTTLKHRRGGGPELLGLTPWKDRVEDSLRVPIDTPERRGRFEPSTARLVRADGCAE